MADVVSEKMEVEGMIVGRQVQIDDHQSSKNKNENVRKNPEKDESRPGSRSGSSRRSTSTNGSYHSPSPRKKSPVNMLSCPKKSKKAMSPTMRHKSPVALKSRKSPSPRFNAEEKEDEVLTPEEEEMMKIMGFAAFSSSKRSFEEPFPYTEDNGNDRGGCRRSSGDGDKRDRRRDGDRREGMRDRGRDRRSRDSKRRSRSRERDRDNERRRYGHGGSRRDDSRGRYKEDSYGRYKEDSHGRHKGDSRNRYRDDSPMKYGSSRDHGSRCSDYGRFGHNSHNTSRYRD